MEDKIKIEFAHICENAIVDQSNNNLSIINIFRQISSTGFPVMHPKFVIVIVVSGEEGKYLANAEIFKKEEDTPIIKSNPVDLVVPKKPAQGRFFVNFSPIVFKSEGSYEIVIKIGDLEKKINFEVKKR